MKHVLLSLVLVGCAGASADFEDEPSEFGQVEQADSADCAGSNRYGVDLSVGWFNQRCNMQTSTASCHFPGGNSTSSYLSAPFELALGSGWTTQERSDLGAALNQAALFIDNQFRACLTPNAPGSPHFSGLATGPGTSHVVLNKGAVGGGTPRQVDTFEDWDDLVHLACTSSSAYTESYPASARRCGNWVGTVDYAKIVAWNNSQRTQVMKNIIKKTFATALGLGTDGTNSQTRVMSSVVSRTTDATQWATPAGSNGEVAWVCNFMRQPYDANHSTLTCY